MKVALIWGYIIGDFGDFYFKYLEKEIEAYKLFKRTDAFAMFLIHIHYVLTKQGNKKIKWLPNFFPGKWREKVVGYDVVICDDAVGFETLKLIKENNPTARLIYWLWNTNSHIGKLNFAKELGYECWSFDKNECEQYDLKFNEQFYPDIDSTKSEQIKYDFAFVGYDKNRLDQIIQLDNYMKQNDCRVMWHVKKDRGKKYRIDMPIKLKNSNLSYSKYIKLLKQTRCIIDIVKADQRGLTVRALEAMAFDKKLITTNTYVREYDFYNPDNIFIWDGKNTADIMAFMDRPYKKVASDIKKKYTISAWLERFDLNS